MSLLTGLFSCHNIELRVDYVCVFYYCRTYYKAVRVGGGGEWRTGAMRDDEPCVFITAVPNTKLCAWGEEDSGGHVL
jgi:hypothetical protein